MDDVLVVMKNHLVGHHLRRGMDMARIAIDPAFEKGIDKGIDPADMTHMNIERDVLRLAMEGGGDGNPHDLGDLADLAFQMERQEKVDDVRAFDKVGDLFFVSLCDDHAVVEDELVENRDMVSGAVEDFIGGNIIMFGRDVGDDAHFMPSALEIGGRAHAGDGGSVVCGAEIVYD